MKAAMYSDSIIEIKLNAPMPVIHQNQILVKVHFAALNPVDYKMRRNPVPSFLVPKPKIPGLDVAGEVGKNNHKIVLLLTLLTLQSRLVTQ